MTTYFLRNRCYRKKTLKQSNLHCHEKSNRATNCRHVCNLWGKCQTFCVKWPKFLIYESEESRILKKNSGGCFSNCETIRLPYIFLTLSLDDLWWNELVEVISKLNSLGLTKEKKLKVWIILKDVMLWIQMQFY